MLSKIKLLEGDIRLINKGIKLINSIFFTFYLNFLSISIFSLSNEK